jgi:hypothetical protein
MSTSRSDDNSSFRAELSAGFRGLSDAQLDALCDHYSLLLAWNERLNLTRVVSAADAARLHYVESLFLAAQLPPGELRIVDVGSGAGFPGIPVAILRPETRVDLVESHQRKGVSSARPFGGCQTFGSWRSARRTSQSDTIGWFQELFGRRT